MWKWGGGLGTTRFIQPCLVLVPKVSLHSNLLLGRCVRPEGEAYRPRLKRPDKPTFGRAPSVSLALGFLRNKVV